MVGANFISQYFWRSTNVNRKKRLISSYNFFCPFQHYENIWLRMIFGMLVKFYIFATVFIAFLELSSQRLFSSLKLNSFDDKRVFDFRLSEYNDIENLFDCARRCKDDARCESFQHKEPSRRLVPEKTLIPVMEETGSQLYVVKRSKFYLKISIHHVSDNEYTITVVLVCLIYTLI